MSQDTSASRFHARVFARRRGRIEKYLLSEPDFRFAADCERMRVDRNGSVLSLLLLRLPAHKKSASDVRLLARILEGRLRTTDTPGRLDDGRIAVLLPDTPAEGAWKVAEDVSDVFPPGPDRPECDVLVYPPRPGDRDAVEEAVDQPAEADPSGSSEFFFAKGLPAWKRAVDVVGAVTGLAVSAPVIALAAAAIKFSSPGPIFFTQEREGLGGRRFRMWKLRTMAIDAEERKDELTKFNEQDGPAFKMRRDPRTTAAGRFLRWMSLDELPQFWNVLVGDMTLVGPRPLPTAESQACHPWQRRRLDVTPGLTCTWQVEGRGAAKFDDWVRMDLQYVEQRGPWKDFKLLTLTVPSVFFQRGMR